MKYSFAVILFFFSATVLSAIEGNHGKPNQAATPVSIVSLIANPEKYHDKAIRIIGAINLEFEGDKVCLHKDDITNRISKNCLWVTLDEKSLGTSQLKLRKYSGRYVLIEGVFNAKHSGHLDLNSGSVDRIWRVMLWPKP